MPNFDSRFGSSPTRGFDRSKVLFSLVALVALGLTVTPISPGMAQAEAPPKRYLTAISDLGKLGFKLPPPPPAPKVSDAGKVDLDQVRAAQSTDAAAKVEAFEDADSYLYDVLQPRFSAAAGRSLAITRRPILAHMLKWLLEDVDVYRVKETPGPDGLPYFRARPFIEDASIKPCNQSYMTFPDKPNQSDSSYPSGHAAHGYIAGLLFGAVMPDREGAILARGVRYGTNRVVCGVHFPTDVATGQTYARFIFDKARNEKLFQDDFACALEEDILDRKGKLPRRVLNSPGVYETSSNDYSAPCKILDVKYFQEALEQTRGATLNLWPPKAV